MPDSLNIDLDDLDVLTVPESPWVDGIRQADAWRDPARGGPPHAPQGSDTTALVRQFRLRLRAPGDSICLTKLEVELLADLLARHKLKAKAGGRPVPIYRLSWAELRLQTANDMVNDLIEAGAKLSQAIIEISEQTGIGEVQLAAFREGKRGSSRRAKKNRPST